MNYKFVALDYDIDDDARSFNFPFRAPLPSLHDVPPRSQLWVSYTLPFSGKRKNTSEIGTEWNSHFIPKKDLCDLHPFLFPTEQWSSRSLVRRSRGNWQQLARFKDPTLSALSKSEHHKNLLQMLKKCIRKPPDDEIICSFVFRWSRFIDDQSKGKTETRKTCKSESPH